MFSLPVQRTGETIPFLLLVQEKGGKRTTQEGEDFDFFPLLTPLIETMKEGDTPSFKTPLRCTDLETFRLRTLYPAGAAAAAPVCVFQPGTKSRAAGSCPYRWGRDCGPPGAAAPTGAQRGSRIQGRRLPPLRGGLYRGENLKDSTTTGRIKGGEKSPPLSFQG